MLSKDEIVNLNQRMLDDDKERDAYFTKCHNVRHLNWELPSSMANKHKVTATDPHDSIMAAQKAMTSLPIQVKMMPFVADQANREYVNGIEKALKSALYCANGLRSETVENDLLESALTYACTAALVVDLEWQKKALKAAGRDTKGVDRAIAHSRFVINTYSPMSVHVRTSNYGTKEVLLAQQRYPHSIIDEYGDVAKDKFAALEEASKPIIYYDFMDDEVRGVYCKESIDGKPIWLLDPDEHGLPFNPWITKMGATTLESNPELQYHSMIYGIVRTGAWHTLNILDTLLMDDAIAVSGAPKVVLEPMSNIEIRDWGEIDYDDPTKLGKPPAGAFFRALQIESVSRGIAEMRDRMSMQMEAATVPKAIRGGTLPSGMSFSAYNLQLQAAMEQLRKERTRTESSIAEILEKMLRWIQFTGETLYVYGMDERDKDTYGSSFVIDPARIDPKLIIINVKLMPNLPTDEMRRANTATLLKQLGVDDETLLEELGYEDPQEIAKRKWMDDQFEHETNLARQADIMQMQMMAQQAMQQAQMAQQQQQMAEQQAMQQREAQMATLQGQGANTAIGGTPAVQGAPPEEAIREMVQGGSMIEAQEEQMV